MITVFRQEIKKMRAVLWVVLVGFVVSALSLIIFRPHNANEIKVASVNGDVLYLDQYQRALIDTKRKIEEVAYYAKAQGLPADLFLALSGLSNPASAALNNLIEGKLLDRIAASFSLSLHPDYFIDALGRTIPAALFDASGSINQKVYQAYLGRLNMSVAEYEEQKGAEFKRNLIKSFVSLGSYVPNYVTVQDVAKKVVEKRFSILEFPLSIYLKRAKDKKVEKEGLIGFFEKNKDVYRTPEKREASYITLKASDYASRVTIDEAAVQSFYNRNKSSRFRIAPQVKVHRLLLGEKASKGSLVRQSELAQTVHKEAVRNPKNFVELVKKYSTDSKSASSGGLVDFFKRGTHDPRFESAAFKLKKPGDVSSVVRTGDGFEIIQLVERKSASTKPLSLVRNEIEKTLRARKEKSLLESDVRALLFAMRSEARSFNAFARRHDATVHLSGWLAKDGGSGYELKSILARKLFETFDEDRNFGFFEHDGAYVVYRESGRKRSNIPPFRHIEEAIRDDYYKEQARQAQKKEVALTRSDVFSRKRTLEQVASDRGLRMVKTGAVKSDGKLREFSSSKGLVEKAFILSSSGQLLEQSHEDSQLLISLDGTAGSVDEVSSEEFREAQEAARREFHTVFGGSFIASLVRVATIKRYENALNIG